jgi:hypothetical protein
MSRSCSTNSSLMVSLPGSELSACITAVPSSPPPRAKPFRSAIAGDSTNSHSPPSFQGPRVSTSPYSPSPVESLKNCAPIGAAQRVEHYEMAAYTMARNLAVQMRQPEIVQLLTTSLGAEQNAGPLLDQVAQPLMSVARMPATVE